MLPWMPRPAHFPPHPGARQILDLSVELVLTSRGFGLPLYDSVGPRETLNLWADRKGEAGIARFWAVWNSQSLDGKPTGIFQD